MLRLRCSINCLNSLLTHCAAPLGGGKGRKCHRRVSRGTLGRRKGAEVSPESVARHPWATERDGSVAGECRAAPLGGGKGRKCHRRVSRGTLGQRKGTKVSPGSVARHPWATERGGSAAGECRAAPLGNGKGRGSAAGECRAVTELAEVAIFAGMVAVILRQMMVNLPNCHIRGNGITFDNTPCVRLRER